MQARFSVDSGDFTKAGSASSAIKRMLKQLGVKPAVVKRVVVALFEAEVNVIAHSYGGFIQCDISPEKVNLLVQDTGPGIPDLDLAMTEGWSTATDAVREMGYGAGMGLPNMKKNADSLQISTAAGKHTEIRMSFSLKEGEDGVS
ncbi:MAG: ATP-binding protein [Sphaerochaetaceae bacterium]|jgi:serine/threonine-protein kinase RsbT|nr:ATP-binding protein [Sphaerochaetaceae bacterium]